MASGEQKGYAVMDIRTLLDNGNLSGVAGAFEPLPMCGLVRFEDMELGTPLSCFIEARLDDDDFATLLGKPADDDGALDEVWVPLRCLDVRECIPVCVGKGTLHMQYVQHNNTKCARITLHWRGKEWAVCLVVLSEAAEKHTEWGVIHYICSNGIEEVPQEMQASVSLRVQVSWRESVSLVESRSACTDTHIRSTALPVPSSASQIMPYAVAGKIHSTVSNSLRRITHISGGAETGMHIVDGKQKKTYADIEIRILPQGRNSIGRTAQIRLPSEWVENSERLQGLQGTGKENQISELVHSEMAYLFGAKNLMPALSTLGIIAQRGHVTLAPDGELPDELRREVMARTGNPPAKANKDTKDRYVKLMHALRWMQIEVKTKEKGKGMRMGYRPLLQVSEYADKENEQARKVNVNTSIVHDVVPMPNALLSVTDTDDPSGIMRALGAMVVMRIALSSGDMNRLDKPESLQKALERAGLGTWWTDSMRKDGAQALSTQIDDAIKKLRGLPFMDGKHQHVADVIGSTHVVWDEKAKGVNVLAAARIWWGVPSWMQVAHPALPAGST